MHLQRVKNGLTGEDRCRLNVPFTSMHMQMLEVKEVLSFKLGELLTKMLNYMVKDI